MFYEKYKEAFEAGTNQAPYQKQLFDLKGIQSSINKKGNVFAKNASNIISGGNPGLNLNINTAIRLEPDRGGPLGGFQNRSAVGQSYPLQMPTTRQNGNQSSMENQYTSRLASASRLAPPVAREALKSQQMVSSMLMDAFTWNDEDNANKFRAIRSQKHAGGKEQERQMIQREDMLTNLQRSKVDIVNVHSCD